MNKRHGCCYVRTATDVIVARNTTTVLSLSHTHTHTHTRTRSNKRGHLLIRIFFRGHVWRAIRYDPPQSVSNLRLEGLLLALFVRIQ